MAAKNISALVLGVVLFGIAGCQDSKVPPTAPTQVSDDQKDSTANGGEEIAVTADTAASDENANVREQRIDDLKKAVDAAIKKNASSG